MSYTLEQFSTDCRAALQNDAGPKGKELVRQYVQKACKDSKFIETYLGSDNDSPRKILYEDPELKFCILAHVHKGAKTSPPHDHGPSWAIYGQAIGTTEMTDWKCLEAPSANSPGLVEKVKTYELEPGAAYLYEVGDLHSPHREGSTRLIRVEGMNMENVQRDAYMIAPQ